MGDIPPRHLPGGCRGYANKSSGPQSGEPLAAVTSYQKSSRPAIAHKADYRLTNKHRLYTFFAPLTVSATLLAVVAAITSVATDRPLRSASVLAATLALVILSTYVLYFQRANASFAEASITHEALPAELARWASWHWFRTTIGLVALASALLALRGGTNL